MLSSASATESVFNPVNEKLAFSYNAMVAGYVLTGASFTSVMLMVEVTATLVSVPARSLLASVTRQLIVRLVDVCVG